MESGSAAVGNRRHPWVCDHETLQCSTPYVVTTPAGATQPLRKRRAVLAMIHAVYAAGAKTPMICSVLGSRFLGVDGVLTDDVLADTFIGVNPKADQWPDSDRSPTAAGRTAMLGRPAHVLA